MAAPSGTVPLDEALADAAADAYRRFGRGRHATGLNSSDCFAYALANREQVRSCSRRTTSRRPMSGSRRPLRRSHRHHRESAFAFPSCRFHSCRGQLTWRSSETRQTHGVGSIPNGLQTLRLTGGIPCRSPAASVRCDRSGLRRPMSPLSHHVFVHCEYRRRVSCARGTDVEVSPGEVGHRVGPRDIQHDHGSGLQAFEPPNRREKHPFSPFPAFQVGGQGEPL